ncbi:uncharacterized protein [Nicotiana tomentosiformis]|uniref:uncharacterized protein n=1 Tax=Nicotiana tomentosiformis TaxID=4098 RepID=UPI00051AEEF0|nr:uncharacterized protein LOC104101072 [Nicotiana tomentosiformis]XP_009606779.1 uncharacterized protein LOC104101072 [Nicotiana tomentosiformis]XP_009606780.1 uncharacterized protein LOC104101072 [Nicotiana tomentosiformis]
MDGFETIQNAWRRYKSQLKKDHYEAYENDELRMAKRPKNVLESEFKDLLKYWNSDKAHAEMENIQSTHETEEGSQSVDAFASVMGPEHPSRLRLYGRGVTKTVLKGKVRDFGPSLNATNEMMQQKMEEIEVRMQQKMQEKFNAQKDAMKQEITINVVAQLQSLNPELRLDPNMLTFYARSPGEASSEQQAAIQLINRPSAGSNNQGGENEEKEYESSEELDLT